MEEFMDEFMFEMSSHFPKMLVQFEDFSTDNAFKYLSRFRKQYPVFNDDIQGTGAVVLGYVRLPIPGTCPFRCEANYVLSLLAIVASSMRPSYQAQPPANLFQPTAFSSSELARLELAWLCS